MGVYQIIFEVVDLLDAVDFTSSTLPTRIAKWQWGGSSWQLFRDLAGDIALGCAGTNPATNPGSSSWAFRPSIIYSIPQPESEFNPPVTVTSIDGTVIGSDLFLVASGTGTTTPVNNYTISSSSHSVFIELSAVGPGFRWTLSSNLADWGYIPLPGTITDIRFDVNFPNIGTPLSGTQIRTPDYLSTTDLLTPWLTIITSDGTVTGDLNGDELVLESPDFFTAGGMEMGSGGSLTSIVLIGDVSGIYTLVPGKTNDTLYNRADPDDVTTIDVSIPRPFGKTAFIGG